MKTILRWWKLSLLSCVIRMMNFLCLSYHWPSTHFFAILPRTLSDGELLENCNINCNRCIFFPILLSVLWPFYAHLMGLLFFAIFFYWSYRMDAKMFFSYGYIGNLCVKISQSKPLKQKQFYHSLIDISLFYSLCNVHNGSDLSHRPIKIRVN